MIKKNISSVVFIAVIALVGLFGMQVYSIVSTLKLNSELFDNNVHNILDHIVDRIEQKELEKTAQLYDLPNLRELFQKNNSLISKVDIEEKIQRIPDNEDSTNLAIQQYSTTEQFKSWSKGTLEPDYMVQYQRFFVQQGIVKDIPIKQRIDLNELDTIIKKELEEKQIELIYAYGLYDVKEAAFVFQASPSKIQAQYKTPEDYKYMASLYPSSHEQIAKLYIDFPTKSSYLWNAIWFHFLGSILFTGIVIFCFYYTIRIIMEQKKLSEMKTDFLNNMTHEFKTPIATISIAVDTIRNWIEKGKAEKALRFTDIIKAENIRMNAQVGKVLQMARIDKKEFNLSFVDVNTQEIIEMASERIALQVEKKEGKILLDLQAQNEVIQADETHFTNMIYNLLDNANKYSPEKPLIKVRTYNKGNGIVIEIEDHGIGISKEARKYIFDKFYRVPTGDIHDIKGFGLGLSYVQAIVTGHGGSIDLRSELGKGTTFIIHLPHKQEQDGA